MQWAVRGVLDDDPLLQACLRDGRYDTQLEEMRGQWLWKMVQAVDAVDRFRVPILHALYALSDDRNAEQLCELASCFAATGDETFRKRLYEIVEERPILECRLAAESAIWAAPHFLVHLKWEFVERSYMLLLIYMITQWPVLLSSQDELNSLGVA